MTLTSWDYLTDMERFNKKDIITDWPREDGTSFQDYILFRVYLQQNYRANASYLEVVWIDDDKRAFNPSAWIRSYIHLN